MVLTKTLGVTDTKTDEIEEMEEVERVEEKNIYKVLEEKYKEKIRELFDLKRDVEDPYYNVNKSAAELIKKKKKKMVEGFNTQGLNYLNDFLKDRSDLFHKLLKFERNKNNFYINQILNQDENRIKFNRKKFLENLEKVKCFI